MPRSYLGLTYGIVSIALFAACAEGKSVKVDPPVKFPAVEDAGTADAGGPDSIEVDAGQDAGTPCVPVDCDDGNPCTADVCQAGVCGHAPDNGTCQDEGDPCTSDICTGGLCTHPATGLCQCETSAQCDDGNPCTDDICGADNKCTNTNNTKTCAPDETNCTEDVCSAGACIHPDNGTCECRTDGDCNDTNPCTDDSCSPEGTCVNAANKLSCAADSNSCTCDVCDEGQCTHQVGIACDGPSSVTINSFDSALDWQTGKTTPAGLAIVLPNGFDNTNLEGNSVLYVAESGSGTIEMVTPSLAGMTKLILEISSDQSNTASMVELGVLTTGAFVDKALSAYGTVGQGSTNFSTLTIPLADFNATPCEIKKVRIDFNVSGGEKVFRIRSLVAEP